MSKDISANGKRKVKSIGIETFVFLGLLLGGFLYISSIMGAGIMFKVIMNTAHDLLLNTVLAIVFYSPIN